MKYYIVYIALENVDSEEKVTTGCVEVGITGRLSSMNDIVYLSKDIEKKFNLRRVIITNWKELDL